TGYRALVVAVLQALTHPLELHDDGIREEQGRVVRRDERGARHLLVGAGRAGGRLEVADEFAANVGGAHATNIERMEANLHTGRKLGASDELGDNTQVMRAERPDAAKHVGQEPGARGEPA